MSLPVPSPHLHQTLGRQLLLNHGCCGPEPGRRAHLLTLEQLPLQHRDPFDRLLVAQAIREELSGDGAFQASGCLLRDARA